MNSFLIRFMLLYAACLCSRGQASWGERHDTAGERKHRPGKMPDSA